MATIALMLESDGPGGAETVLLHLGEALRARGHDVVPVGPAHGVGWLRTEFLERGFTPRSFTLRRPLDPACLRGMIRLLRAERVDVVHSHEFTMAVYGAAAARRLGVPHVITMHGGRNYSRRWRRRAALRWAFRSSRRVVAVSDATRAELASTLGLEEGSISVIRNGIPVRVGDAVRGRSALGVGDGELLILAVGNLYPVKGHIVLLRALAGLPERLRQRPWRVVIAGRGEEETTLRAFADAHGLQRRVELPGFRRDVADLLAGADLFVMPSLSEGLPLALVEAMFAGKPIIASRTGGIPEVAGIDGDALLVTPGNAEELTAALARLLDDRRMRASMGARARRTAEANLGLFSMAHAYEDAYGLQPSERSSSLTRSTPVTR